MDELNRKEAQNAQIVEGCNWVPEYGAWMVEATPNRPYTGFTTDLLRVERNMRLRRKRILTVLKDNEIAPTISAFPMIGAQGDDGCFPPTPVGGPQTLSEYIGDGIINPHPRFGTLTANIRQRRGSKVNIRVPLFRDVNTPEFKDFHEGPKGDVDGCCGGDSQQVKFFEAQAIIFAMDLILSLFDISVCSSGVMERVTPLKKSSARILLSSVVQSRLRTKKKKRKNPAIW
jgi:hypothetical protein